MTALGLTLTACNGDKPTEKASMDLTVNGTVTGFKGPVAELKANNVPVGSISTPTSGGNGMITVKLESSKLASDNMLKSVNDGLPFLATFTGCTADKLTSSATDAKFATVSEFMGGTDKFMAGTYISETVNTKKHFVFADKETMVSSSTECNNAKNGYNTKPSLLLKQGWNVVTAEMMEEPVAAGGVGGASAPEQVQQTKKKTVRLTAVATTATSLNDVTFFKKQ